MVSKLVCFWASDELFILNIIVGNIILEGREHEKCEDVCFGDIF